MTRAYGCTRTALFDLDGTLLPVETDFFLRHYMDALAKSFAGIMPREEFDNALLAATYETIGNTDPATGNLDAFACAFTGRTGLPWERVWPIIMGYYETEYPKLRRHIPDVSAAPIVKKCVENGWDLVLATQPLFPEPAVWERMRWCGVDAFPWRLVTTLDNMHFCKPYLQYYTEILGMAGLDPARCVMIGNNMQEDMVARRVGMKTYLVEDFLLDTGKDMEPDGRGRLEDVPEAIERLLPR